MARCRSGHHEWLRPEDAEKCCNGYRRALIIGDVSRCTTLGSTPLPGGVRYGYRWVRESQATPQPTEPAPSCGSADST